jgi:hypothetical protein
MERIMKSLMLALAAIVPMVCSSGCHGNRMHDKAFCQPCNAGHLMGGCWGGQRGLGPKDCGGCKSCCSCCKSGCSSCVRGQGEVVEEGEIIMDGEGVMMEGEGMMMEGEGMPTADYGCPSCRKRHGLLRHGQRRPPRQIGPAAVPALSEALKDKDGSVRISAASALHEIDPTTAKDAVPALIETLKDKDLETRHTAASALGEIGPEAKDAVPALKSLSEKDTEPTVRSSAKEALIKIEK